LSRSAEPCGTARDEPFAVYLHWPFCAQKCPYCDFNSHVRMGGVDEPRFLAAFQRELADTRALTGPRAVSSIFLGGGTPSLMAPATVGGLIEEVARIWGIAERAEITLEANPNSVEAGRFAGYRAAGVNRVSIGVQALRDEALKRLGRLHDVAEARAAVALAARIFPRFSFDLIYARPGQTRSEWQAELADALAIAGGHLSLYQLTLEAGTPFAALARAGKLVLPEPEEAAGFYTDTEEICERARLAAYEVSNYARPGEESRHNLLYWRYGAYAGVGPGAHGRLPAGGRRLATLAERAPERWLALVEARGHGRIEAEPLSPAEQADEALLMGLRLAEGLPLERLQRLAGLAPAPAEIARLVAQGLIAEREAGARIAATPAGRLVLDSLVRRLALGMAQSRRDDPRPPRL
jgi:oxygen-independent coproporphyrinogen-3 oxidase